MRRSSSAPIPRRATRKATIRRPPWWIWPAQQVAAWAGRVEPATFGRQIAAVSGFFNGAQALVERNNHGHAVLLWLREFSTVRALPGLDKKPGWATTGSSKPMAYDNAAEVFRAGRLGDSRSGNA